jgi:hypothetical protein
MPLVFLDDTHKTVSTKPHFGLCDNGEQKPAYLDEDTPLMWIAVVQNNGQKTVAFYPVDNRLVFIRSDGNPDKICDGLLTHDKTIIFVELKQRSDHKWKPEGDEQLRATIARFEQSPESSKFIIKKAYISNNRRPNFNIDDMPRIKTFRKETGYVLQIKSTIYVE